MLGIIDVAEPTSGVRMNRTPQFFETEIKSLLKATKREFSLPVAPTHLAKESGRYLSELDLDAGQPLAAMWNVEGWKRWNLFVLTENGLFMVLSTDGGYYWDFKIRIEVGSVFAQGMGAVLGGMVYASNSGRWTLEGVNQQMVSEFAATLIAQKQLWSKQYGYEEISLHDLPILVEQSHGLPSAIPGTRVVLSLMPRGFILWPVDGGQPDPVYFPEVSGLTPASGPDGLARIQLVAGQRSFSGATFAWLDDVELFRHLALTAMAAIEEDEPPVGQEVAQALETLGLAGGASREEVQTSYRDLAKQYHPDRFASAPADFIDLANRRMAEINTARDVLLAAS